MQNDYIIIAVDAEKKCAIRFLSLGCAVAQSLELQKPGTALCKTYADFLLASVVLGSRLDDQESILFKLQFAGAALSINCEVSPRGAMRSAIFPESSKGSIAPEMQEFLKVVRLKKGDDVYESVIAAGGETVEGAIRKYLRDSVQTDSLFFLHGDVENTGNNYALWIEKLPETSPTDWGFFKRKYADPGMLGSAIAGTSDPDVIIERLFDDPIKILAVTHPQLTCACSKEKILDALRLLSAEDLSDIFMQGQGVDTTCDYCRKIWQVTDNDVKDILNVRNTLH